MARGGSKHVETRREKNMIQKIQFLVNFEGYFVFEASLGQQILEFLTDGACIKQIVHVDF